jgi:hypothetical protein
VFYQPISIKEAIESVNDKWYLPAVQRPYVWGERHKKEEFIYKLFDSIIREYPIGTLIIWETSKKIPFRPFLEDYDSEKLTKIMDKGLWGKKDKRLVYDGQQRLQSLFSCLKFTFHGKVLCYNLLFDPNAEKEPNGFKFFPKHKEPEVGYIRLNELYSCSRKQLAEFEDRVIGKLRRSKKDLTKKEEIIAKNNLKQLWKIFIEDDTKLLSYYPLQKDLDEKDVLDIFKRINTTGMVLTKSEILFSEIKRIQFDFEEQIWETSLEIKRQTNGFSYSPDNILQILNLLVKGTVRVDPERVDESELQNFVNVWSELESPLKSFFYDFLYREFKMTHEKIVVSKQAMIPLIVYFYYMQILNNQKFRDFSEKTLNSMKKYFLLSQLNYWDLQGYIDNFNKIIKNKCGSEKSNWDFPFKKLQNFVEKDRRRLVGLKADDLNLDSLRWFVLKILTPDRAFSFIEDPDDRFNPEVDHIFPIELKTKISKTSRYQKWVETIWNLQPVKGEINNLKRARSPEDFFTQYPKYLKDYDFLPTDDINDEIWSDEHAVEFIQTRRKKIIAWIKSKYNIEIRA